MIVKYHEERSALFLQELELNIQMRTKLLKFGTGDAAHPE
jgi:hypothetical protein